MPNNNLNRPLLTPTYKEYLQLTPFRWICSNCTCPLTTPTLSPLPPCSSPATTWLPTGNSPRTPAWTAWPSLLVRCFWSSNWSSRRNSNAWGPLPFQNGWVDRASATNCGCSWMVAAVPTQASILLPTSSFVSLPSPLLCRYLPSLAPFEWSRSKAVRARSWRVT